MASFLDAPDKNLELSLTPFSHTSLSISEQVMLLLPSKYIKKLTTSCYLHCYYSQVTSRLDYCNHLFSGFPCLYSCPAVFSHQLNRVAKWSSENTSFYFFTRNSPMASCLRVARVVYIWHCYQSYPFIYFNLQLPLVLQPRVDSFYFQTCQEYLHLLVILPRALHSQITPYVLTQISPQWAFPQIPYVNYTPPQYPYHSPTKGSKFFSLQFLISSKILI